MEKNKGDRVKVGSGDGGKWRQLYLNNNKKSWKIKRCHVYISTATLWCSLGKKWRCVSHGLRKGKGTNFSHSWLGNSTVNSTLVLNLFLLRFWEGHFIAPHWFISMILFWLAAIVIRWLPFFLGLNSFSCALCALVLKGKPVEKSQLLISWFLQGSEFWLSWRNRFHLREQLF